MASRRDALKGLLALCLAPLGFRVAKAAAPEMVTLPFPSQAGKSELSASSTFASPVYTYHFGHQTWLVWDETKGWHDAGGAYTA